MKRSFTVATITILFLCSCASIKPGNDPVVVRAETATSAAVDIIDTFFFYQHTNGADLERILPGVTSAADAMRVNVPRVLGTVRALTKAYKANRTEENKASLLTAIAVLREAADEASQYLAEWNKEKQP